MTEFPKLSITPREVVDPGTLRYGDGFITAEFPPITKKIVRAPIALTVRP
jgi:hypothetical protein